MDNNIQIDANETNNPTFETLEEIEVFEIWIYDHIYIVIIIGITFFFIFCYQVQLIH